MIDKESYVPYYLQIYNELRDKIGSGIYKPEEILPSENQLVEEYAVTRATIRNAINKLKEEGKIYTVKGKGSFISSPKIIQELNKIYTLGKQFYESGQAVTSEIIEAKVENCNDILKEILELGKRETVQVIKVLRSLEGVPSVLQTTYMPTKVLPDISGFDANKESIYEYLGRNYGISAVRAKEYLDPIVADEYYSEMLKVELNTPLFRTERITYLEGDIPFEYRVCIVRNDKVRFSVDLY